MGKIACGTLGPALIKHVGACGEPLEALVARYPHWLKSDVNTNVMEWPFDISDIGRNVCHSTRTKYTIAVGRNDMWNNYVGTIWSVERLREHGCHISLIVGEKEHCGYIKNNL